jgi:hypothetical protein
MVGLLEIILEVRQIYLKNLPHKKLLRIINKMRPAAITELNQNQFFLFDIIKETINAVITPNSAEIIDVHME